VAGRIKGGRNLYFGLHAAELKVAGTFISGFMRNCLPQIERIDTPRAKTPVFTSHIRVTADYPEPTPRRMNDRAGH
jgi:hypothetical protein